MMKEQVADQIKRDPLLRCKDARNRWVCPFCEQVLESVRMETEIQMQFNAPTQIAQHFLQGCARFRPDMRHDMPMVQMQLLIDRINRTESGFAIPITSAGISTLDVPGSPSPRADRPPPR